MSPRSPVRTCRHGRLVGAIVVLALSLAGPALAGLDPAHQAHLTVFGRAASRSAAAVELHVERFELSTSEGRVDVVPTRPLLSSERDAGTPRTWMRSAFASGRLDSLRVVFDHARVRIGGVWTEVDLSGHPVDIEIRRDLAPGECLVLHLDFDPDATSIDADVWRPVLRPRIPERPPLGQRIFVALEAGGTVAVLDRRSGEVVQEIGVGGRPTDLVYSALERRLFVTVAGRDELVAVDLGHVDQLRRLPLRFGDAPSRIILSDDEQDVFVLARGHDALVRISNQSFQEGARIPLEPRPVALVADPRSGRVFVSSELSRVVEVVDPRENAVVDRFEVRDAAGEMVFLPAERELLVAAHDTRSLARLDAGSGATIDSIELCGPVRGLAAQARSSRVFALLALCDQLTVLLPRLELEIESQPLPAAAGRARLDPEGRMLLVTLPEDASVLSINTSRTREVRIHEVGPRPVAVIVP